MSEGAPSADPTLGEASIEALCEQVEARAAEDPSQPEQQAGPSGAAARGARYWSAALPPQEPGAFTPVPM